MARNRNWLASLERLEVEFSLAAAEHRRNPLVQLLGMAGHIADQEPALGAGALAGAVGLLRRDERLAEAGLRVLAAVLVTTLMKSAVERNVTRTRPGAVLDGKPYRRKRRPSKDGTERAFPSGHTADAVTAARALSRVYPQHAAAFWSVAALIALVQLPRGAHYPGDLLAGAAVGFAGEAAAHALIEGAARATPQVLAAIARG